MPIVPLCGHEAIRRRLRQAVSHRALPSSLLLHGPRGIGKQRLALWLGQLLLCTADDNRPCGKCQSCHYAAELVHPDLRWFFPRPRAAESDGNAQEVLDDYAEAVAERASTHGLYAAPPGSDGIFVATVRAIVRLAAFTPTISRRKVIVIGDAERMVSQEGADQAANAFLKLLEEPPSDTTIILTSSEPGALLATIRSRLVALRVAPLSEADVRKFLADPLVADSLSSSELPRREAERVRLAAGAPGTLIGAGSRGEALTHARALLAAARADRAEQMRAILALGAAGARGYFSDVLDALTVLLGERTREAVAGNDSATAAVATRAIFAVEEAKQRAAGNVSPQLLGASLLHTLSGQGTP